MLQHPKHPPKSALTQYSKFGRTCLTNSSFMLRNTEDDDLITQLDVFDEGLSVDQEVIEGMDISNHKDVFRAVYSKVRLLLID